VQKTGRKAAPEAYTAPFTRYIPAASQDRLYICAEAEEGMTGPQRLKDPDTKDANGPVC